MSSTLPTKLVSDRSREVYKYVLYPRQFALHFDHLTTQSRAGLVPEALDKFSPLIEQWNFYCTDIYRIHRGPASQTVHVRDVIPSRSTLPFTPAGQKYEIWVSWSKCLCEDVSAIAADSADLLYSPCVYSHGKSANIHVAGM